MIAEAADDAVRRVEGNVYFPPESVERAFLDHSPSRSWCYWKGRASYFNVTVGDRVAPNGAFTYPKPWPLARQLKDFVAFWHGVRVERT